MYVTSVYKLYVTSVYKLYVTSVYKRSARENSIVSDRYISEAPVKW